MQTAPPPRYHPLLPPGVLRVVERPTGHVLRRMRAEARKVAVKGHGAPPSWLRARANPDAATPLREEIGAIARHEGVSLASMYRRLVSLGLYEYRRRIGELDDAAQ